MSLVPVLEIGGTHATGAVVDPVGWTIAGDPVRKPVDGGATAEQILDAFASAGGDLDVPGGARWGVAMPDPFDYQAGIGRFVNVGKFEALNGIDVRAGLLDRLPGREMVFGNDADAFTVGEWAVGAGRGASRVMGMTLGTGIGSGWADEGRVVDPGIPADGRAHRLFVDGRPLEDVVSRRAIRAAYRGASGDADADVHEIADRARSGDEAAREVLTFAFAALGRALGPAIRDFGAEVLVVGGSMAGSWNLFEPWFREGAADVRLPPIRLAADPDGAPLIGAAYFSVHSG